MNTSMQKYGYQDQNQAGPSYTNYPPSNNPHYNNPPQPTNLEPMFMSATEYDFSLSPNLDVEFGHRSLSRLSLNSNENNDNSFLQDMWLRREEDMPSLQMTLDQTNQLPKNQITMTKTKINHKSIVKELAIN